MFDNARSAARSSTIAPWTSLLFAALRARLAAQSRAKRIGLREATFPDSASRHPCGCNARRPIGRPHAGTRQVPKPRMQGSTPQRIVGIGLATYDVDERALAGAVVAGSACAATHTVYARTSWQPRRHCGLWPAVALAGGRRLGCRRCGRPNAGASSVWSVGELPGHTSIGALVRAGSQLTRLGRFAQVAGRHPFCAVRCGGALHRCQ